ncbi:class I SAM-dependent methyltransferase [Streptomyces mobaraensis]|uniref:Class I SAM-dependent methyltransferase n=1 Tax=Streptomyces mobaraensis TaxID=35621 RepID=A0A5N5WA61_STRMB|nr:class I SAM-dependent methyltransferase [Streptomyces mobaraensis]KAB7846378.1 class I SAM-dependent methyltransferase [Streptomyces mobaraensis]
MAESFGAAPERYDRTRPRYPDALIHRIAAGSPRPLDVLDVGTGTGIAARQFSAAGHRVLGVEVDDRMATWARRGGLAVETAAFETWDPAGRTFDAVVSGQTWHWIDPAAGPAKAAEALRPGGRLAVFWNAALPSPEVAEAFATVYDRLLPGSLAARQWTSGPAPYEPLCARAADGIRGSGAFDAPERWNVEWERTYTRDEWLDQLPTSGAHTGLPPEVRERVLEGVGAAVDGLGGAFTLRYAAVAVTAHRT